MYAIVKGGGGVVTRGMWGWGEQRIKHPVWIAGNTEFL